MRTHFHSNYLEYCTPKHALSVDLNKSIHKSWSRDECLHFKMNIQRCGTKREMPLASELRLRKNLFIYIIYYVWSLFIHGQTERGSNQGE